MGGIEVRFEGGAFHGKVETLETYGLPLPDVYTVTMSTFLGVPPKILREWVYVLQDGVYVFDRERHYD